MRRLLWAAAGLALVACALRGENSIKVGLVAPFSGPFNAYGKEMEAGARAYMKLNGDKVAGKSVKLIIRDTTGVPDIAKRLAQELVVREKVDFLAGFGLTPEALAVADLATQARKPMILMNANTAVITTRSPYIVRFSMTLPQVTAAGAAWAVKNGIRKVFSLVSDYGPGIDVEATFKKAFTVGGGEVVDSVRTPLRNPEFAPFIQRVKDLRPEAVFVFVPAGEQSISFMKGFQERGLGQAGIKCMGTGDLTDDHVLDSMGSVALGLITSFHYSTAHDSPENREFLKAFAEVSGNLGRANFMAVAGYDGMAGIYEASSRLGGKIDGDRAVEALKGWTRMSPRGPIRVDPETRDLTQTVYLRRVEERGGHYENVEFDAIQNVRGRLP